MLRVRILILGAAGVWAGCQADTGSLGDAGAGDAAPSADGGSRDGGFDAGPEDAGHRGTCLDSDDCGGQACLQIPDDPLGWHTCAASDTMEVAGCNPGELGCCASSECMGSNAGCFDGPLWYCSGVFPQEQNECVVDECATTADCLGMSSICLPRRAFGELRRRCLSTSCSYDSDCSARTGGRCMPFFNPCHGRVTTFSCTYSDSECRADADCSNGRYCSPEPGGMTECLEFIPPP